MRLLTLTLQVCHYISLVVNKHWPFFIAVAAHLALYKFTLKTSPPSRFNPNLTEAIAEKFSLAPLQESKEWDRGVIYSEAQNLARTVCSFRPYMWLVS